MDNKNITAVVVTRNRKDMLRRCIGHLRAQQGACCSILVVDNASTDGTGELLAALAGPDLCCHNTGANLGGAGGFNLGMRLAVERGSDYVWVMDDDCLPEPDALAELLKAGEFLSGSWGFLSSAVLWTDGSACRMNRQKLSKNWADCLPLLGEGLLPVKQATFVSLLFPAEVIRRAGLPIREYFIWGDDVEYTRRIAVRMGLDCYLAGRSRVVHAMQANTGSSIADDDPARLDRYRCAFRNEAHLYRLEGFRGECYYLAKCGVNLLRILLRGRDHRAKRAWVLLSSMVRGHFFHPPIEHL